MNDSIDIVIPWVDGSDSHWQKEKDKYSSFNSIEQSANSVHRYASWENLHYWFRAIEKFMPWVNKIFFVTWGHVPEFLNTEHSKLKIVKHTDYIPQKYLPTFNSNVIEMNYHRIEELSENFILFNDDCFPIKPIKADYYFKNNCVCDEAIETPIIPILFGEIAKYTWNVRALNVSIINKYFNKREVQKANYEKWFCSEYGELLERNESLSYWDNFVGFRDPHVPAALKKSTFAKLWEVEPEVLQRTCEAKFRDFSGVNQWLARYWQICEGDFMPRRTLGKSYTVTIHNCEEIAEVIKGQKQQMICINEDCTTEEFEVIKSKINAAFAQLLPNKSSFEK